MSIISSTIAYVLCIILYLRMYQREIPEPMAKKHAVLPVALGMVTPILSTILVLLTSLLVLKVFGKPLGDFIPFLTLKSLVSSFLSAGFPEELCKLLMFLLVARLAKPRNVYECGLLCAGIGAGFTGLEELIYGGDMLISLIRLPNFALHMVFGIIMGTNLGLAKYYQQEDHDKAQIHLFLGLLIPVLWHTVFDAATARNAGFELDDEVILTMAITVAIAVVLISTVFQFLTLIRFKDKCADYCSLELSE